jgi:3-isopropylmalate dehydrogenase
MPSRRYGRRDGTLTAMASFRVLLTPGDGIGPEVIDEAVKVLGRIEKRYKHEFQFDTQLVGGAAIDKLGIALHPETVAKAKKSEAVLFGAVGGPKWDNPQATVRPEDAILGLRKELGLFANIRPVRVHPLLAADSTLKPEALAGTDLVVIRELTGGLYFGEPKKRWFTRSGRQGVDTLRYSEKEIARVCHAAFQMARQRRKKVTSVDKANVLRTGQLWREVATEVGREYPDVTLEHQLVDSCAMRLIREPSSFDVIVTENMFGDILTDEAAMLSGSMGMMPSASLGKRSRSGKGLGLYEPIHGTAPDIAGQGKANPFGMILSAAMMLRLSFGREREAKAIEAAVDKVLTAGYRTPDIAGTGTKVVSTKEMGDLVADAVMA